MTAGFLFAGIAVKNSERVEKLTKQWTRSEARIVDSSLKVLLCITKIVTLFLSKKKKLFALMAFRSTHPRYVKNYCLVSWLHF